jgi:HD-GYP domain-containing protein (c-di-GMP phosphodiesterase class II)
LAARFCGAIDLQVDIAQQVQKAALLHDLGKLAIPSKILQKPGTLTQAEYEKVKQHPSLGLTILQDIPMQHEVKTAILHHHERFDGHGYPNKLKSDEIPLHSRIISICDAFEAMTTRRIYQDAKSQMSALQELNVHRGTQFDPYLTNLFTQYVVEASVVSMEDLFITSQKTLRASDLELHKSAVETEEDEIKTAA